MHRLITPHSEEQYLAQALKIVLLDPCKPNPICPVVLWFYCVFKTGVSNLGPWEPLCYMLDLFPNSVTQGSMTELPLLVLQRPVNHPFIPMRCVEAETMQYCGPQEPRLDSPWRGVLSLVYRFCPSGGYALNQNTRLNIFIHKINYLTNTDMTYKRKWGDRDNNDSQFKNCRQVNPWKIFQAPEEK